MELLKSCSQTFVTINLLSKNFQQGLVLAGAHLDMINNANVNVVMFQAPSGPCLLINTRHAGERWGLIVTKLCHLACPLPLTVHCCHRSLPLKAGKRRSRFPKV